MRSIRTIGLVLGLAILSSMGSAYAASDTYELGTGDYIAICRGEEIESGVPSPANIGGVCFNWSGAKSSIKLEFNDVVSGTEVGFYWQWVDASGEFIDGTEVDPVTGEPVAITGTGCSPMTVPVVTGARGIKIWLDQAFGPLDCDNGAGIATNGTVKATIS